MLFNKIVLIYISGSIFVWWSGIICAILVDGIIGNIHVKLFEIWPVVQMSFKDFSQKNYIFNSGELIVWQSRTVCVCRGHYRKDSCEIIFSLEMSGDVV